jgi:thioredoxin reductase (NADPH)
MNKIYDVIIVGAGPAGISAAIQLKRYGINFLLLEKESAGGLLKNASLVENFPGFPNGIPGAKLITLFKKHLSGLGIRIKRENVTNLSYGNNKYSIRTNKNLFFARNIVLAPGTKPKKFTCNGSAKIKIYHEIYKLTESRNKKIVIVGGGDAAFDYAVSLSGNGNDVSILHRSGKPACIPALLKKVLRKKNIHYLCNLKIINVNKNKSEIVIECIESKNQGKKIFTCDIFIAATGREPQFDFIKTENRKKLDSLKGKSLFYIGDVKNEIYRQATISIGDGIRTAMAISQNQKNEYENYS